MIFRAARLRRNDRSRSPPGMKRNQPLVNLSFLITRPLDGIHRVPWHGISRFPVGADSISARRSLSFRRAESHSGGFAAVYDSVVCKPFPVGADSISARNHLRGVSGTLRGDAGRRVAAPYDGRRSRGLFIVSIAPFSIMIRRTKTRQR